MGAATLLSLLKMQDFLIVFGLALLPALGNFVGGLWAEFLRTSERALNRALHAAAGIVLAIVAIELMPEALKSISPWMIALAFALGGFAYMALEAAIEYLQKKKGKNSSGSTAMWMLYGAVATDLFSDGLMIGAGSAVSPSMALILALGQVLADVPEGYAAIANFKDKNIPRRRRFWLSASFALPALTAATLAYFLLRDQNETLKMAGLVFTAGLLTVAAVEDMVSEAHEIAQDTRWSDFSFIGGFVLFILVSAGFKSYLIEEPESAVAAKAGAEALPALSVSETAKSGEKESLVTRLQERSREKDADMITRLPPTSATKKSQEKRALTSRLPKRLVVQHGDTLSQIAARLYGDPAQWRLLYAANRDRLDNPDLLRAGMELVVPLDSEK
ncbi:Peptidoglycan-binding lysin domain protein [Nitrosococcus watsonii C-113]|nr:Peptidoglycan-binding lysin domain protein [Nitrosococcus watsonii C-113]